MFVYPVVLVFTDNKPSSPIALHKIFFRVIQGFDPLEMGDSNETKQPV